MPTKLNRAGQQQPYVSKGNGDKSGEYTYAIGDNTQRVVKRTGSWINAFHYVRENNFNPPIIASYHFIDRMMDRDIKLVEVVDTLLNYKIKTPVKYDIRGRGSYKLIGNITICISTDTNKIITIYRTRKSIRERF